jgi:2-hydroxy-3-keto-5-methylthiopentenyl-1-phosphate phosphatase
MSAAAHADLLFAKQMPNGESDLMAYCKRETIPFVPFKDL